MNNKVGKIMTDQDGWGSNLFSDKNGYSDNYELKQELNILSDKLAKLDEKINNLREELKSKVELGNNGTSLQPNGEIK